MGSYNTAEKRGKGWVVLVHTTANVKSAYWNLVSARATVDSSGAIRLPETLPAERRVTEAMDPSASRSRSGTCIASSALPSVST